MAEGFSGAGAGASATGMAEASASGGGTLVWVGPTDRPECIEAFRFCAERALQIAPRRTLDDLLTRPAERVGRVVVVRMDRAEAPADLLGQLAALFPSAHKSVLLGADCEGEGRTGQPWPQFERIYWHRWNQILPGWFAPGSDRAAPKNILRPHVRSDSGGTRTLRQNVALIARSQSMVEGVIDTVAALGHAVNWLPAMIPASVRNVDIFLWDDSSAPPTSTTLWRERLAATSGGPVRQRPRHAWMAGFPRIEDWAAARRAGVEGLISKPFNNQVIQDFIEHQLQASPHRAHPTARSEAIQATGRREVAGSR